MILFSKPFRIDEQFRLWTRIILACFCGMALLLGGVLCLLWLEKDGQIEEKKEQKSLVLQGLGPLSLSRLHKKSPVPDLAREILLLGKNLGFSLQEEEATRQGDFLLSLASSKEEYKARNGEQIFLSCDPIAGGVLRYHFSDRRTPLWIRPTCLDNKRVLLEVGMFFPSHQSEIFHEERAQFVLREKMEAKDRFLGAPFLEVLSRSKLWGKDALLIHLGEKDSRGKVQLEIPCEGERVFFFVKEGDFLCWEEGRWALVEGEKRCLGKPLVQVKAVEEGRIHFDVWDPEGFCSYPLILSEESSSRWTMSAELLPKSVRLRTPKQVSCVFGKRRSLLREGDWVLKTKHGWRKLRREEDRKEFLQHKMQGELLVFESLVQEHGRWLLKGICLDPMRTQVQSFTVPVTGEVGGKLRGIKEKKKELRRK